MQKTKILTVFGTRPEVIKLAPFIKEIEADPDCISITCATTQHRELQNNILGLFDIQVNYDLNIMQEGQDLFHITEKVLNGIKGVISSEKPDYVVVQGDTTTTFTAGLSGFYQKIPVVHIEAGLRTRNLYSPYPEEANRSLISRITSLHMAPTQEAVRNLLNEGIVENVYHVGNTIVDAVDWIVKNCLPQDTILKEKLNSPQKKVLITVHRRENFGEPLNNICKSIIELCRMYPDFIFIWPVHPNPNVQRIVHEKMNNLPNLYLLPPLSYTDLINIINNCELILSDSGGIQEEACILGKNIIILRDETERPEVVEAGYGMLAGANPEKIKTYFSMMINSIGTCEKSEIYGKPGVSRKILEILK